mgnify:CR=1 FL=1
MGGSFSPILFSQVYSATLLGSEVYSFLFLTHEALRGLLDYQFSCQVRICNCQEFYLVNMEYLSASFGFEKVRGLVYLFAISLTFQVESLT